MTIPETPKLFDQTHKLQNHQEYYKSYNACSKFEAADPTSLFASIEFEPEYFNEYLSSVHSTGQVQVTDGTDPGNTFEFFEF